MKKYVLIICIDNTYESTLLLLRNKDPYKDLFNAVGGKIEVNESYIAAAYREFEEETGVKTENMKWLVTCNFPSEIELNVYYTMIPRDIVQDYTVMEEGTLCWFRLKLVESNSISMAGEGNLPYFVKAAMADIKKEISL